MQTSWTQQSAFRACQRKWELGYLDGISKPDSAESRSRLIGSAVHAGIQAFLRGEPAVTGGRKYLSDHTNPNAMIYNWDKGEYAVDTEYYTMMNELHNLVPDLLRFYVPLLGIGTKYRIATRNDVFGDGSTALMIEHEVSTRHHRGFIDAVLVDLETGENIVVDWKCRTTFPWDSLIMLDGQLQLYAALLVQEGAKIDRAFQVNIKNKSPKPAKINKNGSPSIAQNTLGGTTWEQWCATLPEDIKPEHWEEQVRPLVKPLDFFLLWVELPIDTQAMEMALYNAEVTRKSMAHSLSMYRNGQGLPAATSSNGCQWCDFLKLCTAIQHGGDTSELIEREYIKEVNE